MMLPLNEQLAVTLLAWSAILLTAFFLGLRLHRTLAAEQQKQRSVVELVHAELPQTQCGQCGFPGCLPYAEAISGGEPINQCPPGGERLILRLARLLNEPPEPLNPVMAHLKQSHSLQLSGNLNASAAPNVFKPARLMPS